MSSHSACDVAIVGAGPSGSVCAYHLAKAGLKVRIFEAKRFPRQKPCGGGIQARGLAYLPVEIKALVRASCNRVHFSAGLKHHFTREALDPLVYCVFRTEFDDALLEAARTAGAEISQGVRVLRVVPEQNGVHIVTDSGEYDCRYVVGADGANSITGRVLNDRSAFYWQTAIFAEVPLERVCDRSVDQTALRVDWGTLPSGYAWLFPKGGAVNVGAGAAHGSGRKLRSYLESFLKGEGIATHAGEQFTGHQLPTMTSRTKLASGRVLLVGDAAGLVEPLTGEGITFACQSGGMASAAVVDRFEKPDLWDHYRSAIRSHIEPELFWGYRLLQLSTLFPRAVWWRLRTSRTVWEGLCAALRGTNSLQQLEGDLLGWLSVFLPRAARDHIIL